MGVIADEILSNYGCGTDDALEHYGMPRRSGRYPWGSGDDPYQHNVDFLSRVEALKKQGWVENAENVKKEFGVTLNEYRNEKSWCNYERRMLQVKTAESLKADNLGPSEIGRRMGLNESTVRSLLDSKSKSNMEEAKNTADFLKARVDEKGMVDVGTGVERELNVSRTKLNAALYYLQGEGYELYEGGIPQPTNPGQQTIQQVLCKPGTPYKEIYNYDKIATIKDYVSHDNGETFDKFVYPKSLDSNRIMVRPAEDGGTLRDGLIEIRRGVEDLSLGDSHYAQVRILVDNKKYIKGMAIYSDDMPPGVDVIVNSNKSKDKPKLDHLKDIKDDPDNPFGSAIKAGGQSYYIDKDGKKQLRVINKRADEGDWDDWKDALPSQFLGKQSLDLAKKQLGIAKADKQAEFDEIMSITNPTVKKYWLEKFSSDCDAAAVNLQAAALPGQKYHVIIPVNTLKDNEIYAPKYKDGTKLALVRYPHGGTFEIPIVTVNNKHPESKKLLGPDVKDAVGINSKVAERLSGADFDGDTVMCIPTHDRQGKVKIASTPELEGLKGFDTKAAYPEVKGMKYMKDPVTGSDQTQKQMGMISNLITDMTLGGAGPDEMARAVKHSMVVIDAKKHKLNYKQSEIDNNISALTKEYQRKVNPETGEITTGSASTILSRAKGRYDVVRRKGQAKINIKGEPWYDPNRPEGALIYKEDENAKYIKRTVNKRTGEVKEEVKYRTQRSTNMAETDDAYTLVSANKYPMEIVYADYANSMKAMANKARVEMYHTPNLAVNAAAKKTYANEVASLEKKLNEALLNTPKERAAIRQTNAVVKAKKLDNPDMSKEDIRKANQQALSTARHDVGSLTRKQRNITLTDKEWEAIQAGAISDSKLRQILNNTDADDLRQRSTPRQTTTLSPAKISKIQNMSSTYTIAQIAEATGLSTSTVTKYLKTQ